MRNTENQPENGRACGQSTASCYAIDTAPQKKGAVFLAWHVLWKCWIPVKARQNINCKDLAEHPWIEATGATAWPERAFSHWMPMPENPQKQEDALAVCRLMEFTRKCAAKSELLFGA